MRLTGKCSIIDEVGLNIFTKKKLKYIGFVLGHMTFSTNRIDAIPAKMNASSAQQHTTIHDPDALAAVNHRFLDPIAGQHILKGASGRWFRAYLQ